MNAQIFVSVTAITFLLLDSSQSLRALAGFCIHLSGNTTPDVSPKVVKYLLSDRHSHKVYSG